MWCITAGAKERGKTEDIVRLFNWCFSQEGAYLYNYGIEGVSYTMENGVPVLITEGVCKLRDKAVRGKITVDEFFAGYDQLKNEE